MSSLTETAYYSRKIIKYGSVMIVTLLILRSVVIAFKNYWTKIHPPPPPPPTVAFGKLPKIKFPNRPGLPAISLRSETIENTFPKLSESAKVYFMPDASPNLLAIDSTKTFARKLGFTNEPEITNQFDLKFFSDTSPKTTLEINALTKNFYLYYNWKEDVNIISQANPPPEPQAISSAKSLLQSYQVLTDDLKNGNQTVTYLKYNQGKLETTLFFSEANFAKVNLFRQDIDSLKMMTPTAKESNVYLILSAVSNNNENSKEVIEVKYFHFPISLEKFATYPIKDVNLAWKQLAEGKGFIANLGNNSDGKVIVREAYLAYYDSNETQSFLQPIVVFEGDRDFVAYVSAITDNWVE